MATIIAFIVVFFVLVLVHEFGHFIFAKRSGILVREFSIGMGPKLIATRRNHTTYTLRLLPLGGYVRMAGWQDEDDEIKPGTQLAIELNSAGVVTRINTSDKTTLQGGIPVQVGKVDLTHDLVIELRQRQRRRAATLGRRSRCHDYRTGRHRGHHRPGRRAVSKRQHLEAPAGELRRADE